MLFSKVLRAYMGDKRRRLRGNTIEGYVSCIRCHVAPQWSARHVETITHEELQRWADSIPAPGAARKAYTMFRMVYRWALRRMGLRLWDITQGVELPHAPRVERAYLRPSDERAMLQGIRGQEWEAVVLCAAALGLRPSEALGLDWADFDWRSGWVRIRRGAHWVGGRVVEYATKTRHSTRDLKLPRFALARLRALRGSRRSGRLRGDLTPCQIKGRFRRFCRRFGLPWVPMQALRHTWATVAVEAGAALADVAVALGHTGVDMVYRHYLLSARAVVQRAQGAFEGVLMGVW